MTARARLLASAALLAVAQAGAGAGAEWGVQMHATAGVAADFPR